MRINLKQWVLIFTVAFGLNLVWENLHSVLYLNYQGGEITSFILFWAALGDALMITAIVFLWSLLPKKFRWQWVIIIIGIIVAIILEKWALGTNRWVYKEIMPIVPILNTGFTPTIQLGLTGFITARYVLRLN